MKKRIAFILLLSMFTLLMLSGCGKSKPTASNKADATNNVAVSDGNVISGTGVLQPVDTYTISASVMGDVLSANFEEGQIVKQGDVLYSIDQSDLKANIDKASIAIERSELAVKQTSDNIAKQTVKAKTSGTVTKMYVSKGATIAVGTPVCDIVNDEQMILRVPFLVENAQNIFVGESATVPLVGTYYTLSGSVSKVTNGHLVSSMGNEVSMIEITVQNPGTLKKDDKATAVIGDYACSDVGTFDYASTETVTSEGAGKILNLPISVGDHVTSQTALANLDTSTLVTANEQNALAIKDAKLSLQSLKDKVKDYNISAPITGTILTKNVKAGDTVSQANMSALAVMADLKNLCFKITVDDTDIAKVKLGQSVKFKTDAMPDKEHFGTVSFIPDAGTKTGDATLYEVRVSVKPEDDLKNGMNVSAEILLN